VNTRALGNTGIITAPIGLGTVKLGRVAGLKFARVPTVLPSDDEALVLLGAARDLGVTLIDTSPAYGVSEARLGELLGRVAGADQWTLCTKAGETFDEVSGESSHDFSAGAIRASIERSLVRLRVKRVDIALLHFSSGAMDAEVLERGEAMGALEGLKREGKCRVIGASIGSLEGGRLAIELGCDVVMVTLNALDRSMEPVIEAAAARGVGVLIKKALGSGRAAAGSSVGMVVNTPGVGAAVVGTTSAGHLREAVEAARGRAT